MVQQQYNWIVSDLIAAYDSGRYDWIIAYAHRPMYCSNIDDIPDCSSDAEVMRMGPKGDGQWGIETALSVRPVDMFFAAHEHSYVRKKKKKKHADSRTHMCMEKRHSSRDAATAVTQKKKKKELKGTI